MDLRSSFFVCHSDISPLISNICPFILWQFEQIYLLQSTTKCEPIISDVFIYNNLPIVINGSLLKRNCSGKTFLFPATGPRSSLSKHSSETVHYTSEQLPSSLSLSLSLFICDFSTWPSLETHDCQDWPIKAASLTSLVETSRNDRPSGKSYPEYLVFTGRPHRRNHLRPASIDRPKDCRLFNLVAFLFVGHSEVRFPWYFPPTCLPACLEWVWASIDGPLLAWPLRSHLLPKVD